MTDHVALVTDAGYVPWCATAVRSLLDAHPGRDLHVHVLHDGSVPPADREALAAMASPPARVEWHEVDARAVAHLPALDRFGRIVWLRFLLPELLADVERCLYLDADVLVVDDLGPLLTLDLDGAALGAAANVVPPEDRPRLAAIGVTDHRTFLNSGVLVMDLARLRAEGLLAQAGDAVAAFGDAIVWPDQDVLNIVHAGRWRPIHPRFNAQNSLFAWPDLAGEVLGPAAVAEAVERPAVVHFEGPSLCKPWHALSTHPWRDRYRATLARTPWADVPLDDDTPGTRAVARLPERWQLGAYRGLVRARSGPRALAAPVVRSARSRAGAVVAAARGGAPPVADGPAPQPDILSTASPEHQRRVQRCLPYTMGSPERLLATIDAAEHVVRRGVPGALVECGVWRGGSVLAMVLSLQSLGVDDRDVYLFDTFTGMTEPTDEDTSGFHAPASEEWTAAAAEGRDAYGGLFAPSTFGLDQVRRLLHATGYPPEHIHLVAGPVEETLPGGAPDEVALLRLDTDWYSSTRHELEHLYPRLARGGVLIVDDYGHWEGARKALDEHLADEPPLLMARTDYTGRMMVRT